MRLIDFARAYVSAHDGSNGYYDQLRCAIACLERHCGESLDADGLTPELVSSYIRACKDRLAPVTRRNRRNMLWRLLEAACRAARQPLPDRRDRPAVKVPCPVPHAWTVDQVRHLLTTAKSIRGRYRKGPIRSHYWTAYILTVWDLGIRGVDARNLRMEWIATDGRVVSRQQKTGKPIYGRLRPVTLQALYRLRKQQPLERWNDLAGWRRRADYLVKLAGLPGTIGWLRHSAATNVEINHPGQGYQFAGNSPAVFYRYYCDRSQLPLPQSEEL